MHKCPFCKGSRSCPNSNTTNAVTSKLLMGFYSCGIIWCGRAYEARGFGGTLPEHPCGACAGTGVVGEALYRRMTTNIAGNKWPTNKKPSRMKLDPKKQ